MYVSELFFIDKGLEILYTLFLTDCGRVTREKPVN
jgi:hypothetical protein